MSYLHWKQETLSDLSSDNITSHYNQGFVFTRIGRGVMHQTRSIRIKLRDFTLSSENRRIMKKTEGLTLKTETIPLRYTYHFSLAKIAKDFYSDKFGEHTMSAQKIKEMLTDSSHSNFTTFITFSHEGTPCGYAICYENESLLHYSYPFYDITTAPRDIGLGMMIRALIYAQEKGLEYVYLGSLQRPTDTYKLQFSGIEWFDGTQWSSDIEEVKTILKNL